VTEAIIDPLNSTAECTMISIIYHHLPQSTILGANVRQRQGSIFEASPSGRALISQDMLTVPPIVQDAAKHPLPSRFLADGHPTCFGAQLGQFFGGKPRV